jgi:hypothetical protein
VAILLEHEQTIYDFLVRLRGSSVRRPRSRISLLAVVSPLGGSRAVVPPHQQYRTTYSSWRRLAVPTGTSGGLHSGTRSRRRIMWGRVDLLSSVTTYTCYVYDSFS